MQSACSLWQAVVLIMRWATFFFFSSTALSAWYLYKLRYLVLLFISLVFLGCSLPHCSLCMQRYFVLTFIYLVFVCLFFLFVGSPGCSLYPLRIFFLHFICSVFFGLRSFCLWVHLVVSNVSVGSVFDLICNLCVLSISGGCSHRVLGHLFFSSSTSLSACCLYRLRNFVPHLHGSYGWHSFCLVVHLVVLYSVLRLPSPLTGSSGSSLYLLVMVHLIISTFWSYCHCVLKLVYLAA